MACEAVIWVKALTAPDAAFMVTVTSVSQEATTQVDQFTTVVAPTTAIISTVDVAVMHTLSLSMPLLLSCSC